jgi:HNH endonuclease
MTTAEREEIARRASYCCEYCLSQLELCHDDFSIEHIQPKSAGGTDLLDNLALSCQGCNNRKYTATMATDPITGQIVPLYHPRQDRWEAHFCWDEDFANLLGLTPTGRATIARLDLNRPRLVNLRQALTVAGKHPPERT